MFSSKAFLFQSIWVCILCRKKQEILIQSGSWAKSSSGLGLSGPSSDPVLYRMEQDIQGLEGHGPEWTGGGGGMRIMGPRSLSMSGSQANTPTAITATHFQQQHLEQQQQQQQQQPFFHVSGTGLSAADTPSASSTISSFFNRALSLTPSTPNLPTALFSGLGVPTSSASGSGQQQQQQQRGSFLRRGVSLDRPPSSLGMSLEGLFARTRTTTQQPSEQQQQPSSLGARPRAQLRQQRSLEGSGLFPTPSSVSMFPSALSRRISTSLMGGVSGEQQQQQHRHHYPAATSPAASISSSSMLGSSSSFAEAGGRSRRLSETSGRWPPPPTSQASRHHMRAGRLTHGLSVDSGGSVYAPRVSAATAAAAGLGGGRGLIGSARRAFLSGGGGEFSTMSAPEDAAAGFFAPGLSAGEEIMSPGGTIKSVGFFGPRSGMIGVAASDNEARDLCPPMQYGGTSTPSGAGSTSGEPGLAVGAGRHRSVGGGRRRMDSSFRTDSLSSDQSEQQQQQQQQQHRRPHPPRPHRRRGMAAGAGLGDPAVGPDAVVPGGGGGQRRTRGEHASSSEEEEGEVRSTPDYTSYGDDIESESISEVGEWSEAVVMVLLLYYKNLRLRG